MNYLTRISVTKMEAAGLLLKDHYDWHKKLWTAFPGVNGGTRPFLSRIDASGEGFQVLMLSSTPPERPPWGLWETKAVSPGFLDCERYRFSLRANPTVKRVVRDDTGERKKNGRRTAIYDQKALADWLRNKARQSGFELERFEADPPVQQSFIRKRKPGKHIRVDFRGVLRVTDRPLFQKAFQNGIGPAKAFGFGMLMLAPLTER